MRLVTPEIAWHETLPVYSCDVQPYPKDASPEWTRLATSGGDKYIRLWKICIETHLGCDESLYKANPAGSEMPGNHDFLSTLDRHDKPVNVVRWSPSGNILASGSDDSMVILWKKNESQSASEKNLFGETDNDTNQESWTASKVLRRHLEDVYDLCWARDEEHLVSGSVDQCMIQWKLASGQSVLVKDHRQYVQGVAWDPRNKFVVSVGSDRSCRVYRVGARNCLLNVMKHAKMKLFQDDSWKSFFRRPQFSPDGHLFVCPAGCLETSSPAAPNSTDPSPLPTQTHHAAHIFHRSNLSRPLVSFNTLSRPVIAVRFCPQKFQLRTSSTDKGPLFALPYRWVLVLVLEDGLLFHDTQSLYPFMQVSSIHYQALNDASWSLDGRILVACSTDGYCTMVRFDAGELGEPYVEKQTVPDILGEVCQNLISTTPKDSAGQDKTDTKPLPASTKRQSVTPVSPQQQKPQLVPSVSPQPVAMVSSLEPVTPPPTKRRVSLITLDSSVPSTPTNSSIMSNAKSSPFAAASPSTVVKTTTSALHPGTPIRKKKDSENMSSPSVVTKLTTASVPASPGTPVRKTGDSDADVVGKPASTPIPSGSLKRRVPFVTLTKIDESDYPNISSPSNCKRLLEDDGSDSKEATEPRHKKRRVSFATLQPEVRLYSPSGKARDVASSPSIKINLVDDETDSL